MDFETIFATVTPPEGDPDKPLYAVTTIPGFEHYLLGKDRESCACLLVATDDYARSPQAPIRLESLDVQFDLRCQLSRGFGQKREGVFTVIRCRSRDRETTRYFLSVCETVTRMLSDKPTRQAVSSAVNRLVAIFRRAHSVSARSVNGLFGELYLIWRSENPLKAVTAWRMDEKARFDFTSGDVRLDVKAAGGRLRTHAFSYEQCNPPPGTIAVVASLFAERIAGGLALRSIIDQINAKIAANTDMVFKLHEVVVSTLGSGLNEAFAITFDLRLAESSLQFFNLSDVPAIRGPLPSGVSDVHFSSDLSALQPRTRHSLADRNPAFADLLPRDSGD